jgi:hypothetical protein
MDTFWGIRWGGGGDDGQRNKIPIPEVSFKANGAVILREKIKEVFYLYMYPFIFI